MLVDVCGLKWSLESIKNVLFYANTRAKVTHTIYEATKQFYCTMGSTTEYILQSKLYIFFTNGKLGLILLLHQI